MREISQQDERMMRRALDLSSHARIIAPPNPWVGCIIMNNNKIIGEGYTQPPGQAHAEAAALHQAKDHAQGATVYVTLEPCSHFGRTPPCTQALIDAKVKRVVIGVQDPDPQVQGKGIARLQAAGIEVSTGAAKDEITRSLASYLHHRRTGRPYCLAKAAASIDGRVAAADGTSQWISSEQARQDVQKLRAESQAILIGAGTACKDLPRLTVRQTPQLPLVPPLRVILDAKGSVPAQGPLFDTAVAPTLILTTEKCPAEVKRSWLQHHVDVVAVSPSPNGLGVDLQEALDVLGKRGILQVLVEGGGTVLGAFFEAKLLQHFCLYIGARILGSKGIPLLKTELITTLAEAPQLNLLETKTFGDTVRIDYAFR